MLCSRFVSTRVPSSITYSTTRSIRMLSAFHGASGRRYLSKDLIREHPVDPRLNIYKAESEGESFVYKKVSSSIFGLSERLSAEFAATSSLRMHVDSNREELILVYRYCTGTLLSLLKEHPGLPKHLVRRVVQQVARGVKELHDRGWLHLDLKPDNIMVDWTVDEQGQVELQKVLLSDFDIAFKLPEDGFILRCDQVVGSIFWRSPEGQTGKGLSKASDIYAFALIIIYALGGQGLIVPPDWREMAKTKSRLLSEILTQHLLYFGPLQQSLLNHIADENWTKIFMAASVVAEEHFKMAPQYRFAHWPDELVPGLDPDARDMVAAMAQLDPAVRAPIGAVLQHPWWEKECESLAAKGHAITG